MKSWKTTLIGLALIGAGIYTGVTAKTSWTESAVIITMGAGFLVAKDHNATGV
jgi:general stress protein CsbA